MRITIRTTGIILLLTGFLSSQQALLSQEFLKKTLGKKDITFYDLQRSFDEWVKTEDLSITKGWKQFRRWEDFNTKRASMDGSLPDPRTYYYQAIKVIDQKKQFAKANNDNYSWTPVGLFEQASVYSDENAAGIGRINCMAFHPTDPNTFWVGVGQGGVWKTTNHGESWIPITDELPLLRISDICVDKNNPDIMYISVGDFAYIGIGLTLDHRKRHSHFGIGVFKTKNGGQTWEPTGLSFEQTIYDGSLTRRVFIDESDSDELIAAGTNGVWKSKNGGDNWFQVDEALIWDIERDPNNPDILYASKGYVSSHDIGECGIIKTYDFGNTWTEQDINVPSVNETQRLEIAISSSNSNYVYVAVSKINGGLYGIYATTDGGQNWKLKANSPNIFDWYDGTGLNGIGSYALAILVDPDDKNKLYAGSVNLWGSDDGGTTWDAVTYLTNTHGESIHCDQHFLTYNPIDREFYICNDGGLYSTDEILIGSWNDAKNQPTYRWPTHWTSLNSGLVITSFYRIGLSKNNRDYLIGGAQDNNSFYYNTSVWYNIFSGDGMECIIHPTNPNIIYCSLQRGNIGKSIDGGLSFNDTLTKSIGERGEWLTPYVMHPTNPEILFAGYGNLWKTSDGGLSWSKKSDFPSQQYLQQPCEITSVAISKSNPDVIYISKRPYHYYDQPGAVWKTTNSGSSWSNITRNLPGELYFTYLAVDDANPNTAWITCAGFEDGFKVYKTINGGTTWDNISRNLPNLPVNCIVEHQNKEYNPVYIGMDVGVYYTNDTANGWMLYSNELPNVIVSELEIHEESNKLFAATFGRGIWNVDLYESNDVSGLLSPIYDSQLEVFPNPSNGDFEIILSNFNIDNASLKIIDGSGRQVFSSQIVNSAPKIRRKYSLDLKPGFYYIIISDKKHRKATKLIVQ